MRNARIPSCEIVGFALRLDCSKTGFISIELATNAILVSYTFCKSQKFRVRISNYKEMMCRYTGDHIIPRFVGGDINRYWNSSLSSDKKTFRTLQHPRNRNMEYGIYCGIGIGILNMEYEKSAADGLR